MTDEDTRTLVYEPETVEGAPDVFVDAMIDREYRAGEHQVSDELAARYVSHPSGGWHDPAGDTPEIVATMADEQWNTVKAAIEDGRLDGHLEKLEVIEEDRSNGPRESVMSAIRERRAEIDTPRPGASKTVHDADTDDSDVSEDVEATDDDSFEAALDRTFDDSMRDSLDELDPVDASAHSEATGDTDDSCSIGGGGN